ncbi:hypothetical protein [Paenibacillus herberti]|uniref:Uncharacterized protein n=1 Tax=Paenibacillus herberti TaxID=1619309 RepID=A0A229NTX3_9BACL|nr:hypothetical protein [Paenibacillus herberti]OXM13361.1 hypothetical protein CGZ75_20065 [Paenibacillus herberti]
MSYEREGVNKLKGSNMGIILVLFILLVIVTCAVNTVNIPPPDDGSSSITATRGFDILNNTQNITFDRVSIEGSVAQPYPMSLIPPGVEIHFNLTSSFTRSTGTVTYIASVNNQYVGGLRFSMVSFAGINTYFSDVITNGAFDTSSSFPLLEPLLTIYDL